MKHEYNVLIYIYYGSLLIYLEKFWIARTQILNLDLLHNMTCNFNEILSTFPLLLYFSIIYTYLDVGTIVKFYMGKQSYVKLFSVCKQTNLVEPWRYIHVYLSGCKFWYPKINRNIIDSQSACVHVLILPKLILIRRDFKSLDRVQYWKYL